MTEASNFWFTRALFVAGGLLVLVAAIQSKWFKRIFQGFEVMGERPIYQQTYGANSPAMVTTGDNSPITVHAAPLRRTFELDLETRKRLINCLSMRRIKIGVVSLSNDDLGVPTADRFVEIFKEAGWDVVATPIWMVPTPGKKALMVLCRNSTQAQAEFLCGCLRTVGVCAYTTDPSPDNQFYNGAEINLRVYTKGAD